MRRALAVVAALMLSLPAIAAEEDHRDERGRPQAGHQAGAEAPVPQENRAPTRGGISGGRNRNQAQPAPAAPAPNVAQERGRPDPQAVPNQRGPARNLVENRDRDRDARERRDSDRGRDVRGRDRGNRYFNFRGRQYAAIRGPAFSYPRGWGYRHWYQGDYLPRIFIAAPFFFDFDLLGLPPPPPGARWVRNGPDALLVSVYNGRIIDVIYDAFY